MKWRINIKQNKTRNEKIGKAKRMKTERKRTRREECERKI